MKRAITMLAGLAALAAALPAAAQDTVAKVKQAGVIVGGVKQDYKPWGYLDPTGKIVGFESDVAQRLGVKTELVPVTAVTRMEFLKNGRLDMVIATMGDTPDRSVQGARMGAALGIAASTMLRMVPLPRFADEE